MVYFSAVIIRCRDSAHPIAGCFLGSVGSLLGFKMMCPLIPGAGSRHSNNISCSLKFLLCLLRFFCLFNFCPLRNILEQLHRTSANLHLLIEHRLFFLSLFSSGVQNFLPLMVLTSTQSPSILSSMSYHRVLEKMQF